MPAAGDGGDDHGNRSDANEAESSAARQARYLENMKLYATVCAAAAVTGIVFMVVQHEYAVGHNAPAGLSTSFCEDVEDLTCDPRVRAAMFPITQGLLVLNIIRGLGITLTTLVALVCLYKYYSNRLDLMKAKNQAPPTSSLITNHTTRWSFILEMTVLAIHIFPG
ncbi:hypothetical protein EON67_09260, partial [archaeon]